MQEFIQMRPRGRIDGRIGRLDKNDEDIDQDRRPINQQIFEFITILVGCHDKRYQPVVGRLDPKSASQGAFLVTCFCSLPHHKD